MYDWGSDADSAEDDTAEEDDTAAPGSNTS